MESAENEGQKEIDKKVSLRKEKIFNWLKDPYNKTFLVILIFAIVIRIYYFSMSISQPLWYDEAEYMSGGVHWAFGVPFHFSMQRPILFHFLIAVLLKVGFAEPAIKFLLSTLPGILIVLFSYLLVQEMYDKKTALITSTIFSFFWMSLFYGNRMMTDLLSLFLGLLTVYFFWKGYIKGDNKYYVWLIGCLVSLSIMLRLIGVLFGIIIGLFVILTEGFKFLKKKDWWISLAIAIITILPFLIWFYSYHGNALGFLGSNLGAGQAGDAKMPFAWHLLKFVLVYFEIDAVFFKTGLFIMFLLGLFTLFNLITGLDLFFKKNDKTLYADFFNFLSLIFILAFFIFYFKMAEDRWMIAMAIPLFIFASKGLVLAHKQINDYAGKTIAILFVLALLLFAGYVHVKFAGSLIETKKDSYAQVKYAGLWIKANSEKTDIMFSDSITQNTYYSERETLPFGTNETEFFKILKEKKPKYLIVSAFENYAPWALNPSKEFINLTTTVNVFFFDEEQKQPALIIYGYNGYDSKLSS